MPDLRISSLRAGDDGLVNDVLIVNEELVFRFARDEAGCRALEREARLLAFVRPRVSLPVPEIVRQHQDCIVYRFIPGVPLDRRRLLALDASSRSAVLEQLGRFLHELHGLEPVTGPMAESADTRKRYEDLYQSIERELLDLSYAPVMIHGDLAPYHLCFDPTNSRLNGVIDFGNAGPGDPALDIGSLILAFGESLLRHVETVYPAISGLLDRARFYGATLELVWALAAVRSRDPAWFLCHLGYARDTWPVGWRSTV